MRNPLRRPAATPHVPHVEVGVPAAPAGSRLPAHILRVGAAVLGIAMASVLMIDGTRAAFNDTTDSQGNSVSAGTVVLTDDDENQKLFDVSGLNGGQQVVKCINVSYSGSLDADVHLYGAVAGELAPGLTTRIELGSGATGGSSFDCAGFSGGTTLHNGTLQQLGDDHASYATGLAGFDGATDGTEKSYRITMTVSNDNTYQGKSATVGFTWEAQGKDA